jgi:hypothetical protein
VREISKEEYRRDFCTGKRCVCRVRTGKQCICKSDTLNKEAYKIAEQNRVFQIESHLKRAHYFWLFQATAYAGYFYSITAAENNCYFSGNPAIIVGITCLGFLTALAWHLSNIASKKMQDNWEEHVAALENKITGPLYKTINYEGTWSIAKVNGLVSLFSIVAWILLGAQTVQMFNLPPLAFLAYFLVLGLISCVFCFWGKGSNEYEEPQWFRLGGDDE